MWQCIVCKESLDNTFRVCWQCSRTKGSEETAHLVTASETLLVKDEVSEELDEIEASRIIKARMRSEKESQEVEINWRFLQPAYKIVFVVFLLAWPLFILWMLPVRGEEGWLQVVVKSLVLLGFAFILFCAFLYTIAVVFWHVAPNFRPNFRSHRIPSDLGAGGKQKPDSASTGIQPKISPRVRSDAIERKTDNFTE